LIAGVEEGVTDIFANFANSDMVGHAMTQLESFDGMHLMRVLNRHLLDYSLPFLYFYLSLCLPRFISPFVTNMHAGVVQAILELDTQLARLVPVALAKGYTVRYT
jgi:hypothetical protein